VIGIVIPSAWSKTCQLSSRWLPDYLFRLSTTLGIDHLFRRHCASRRAITRATKQQGNAPVCGHCAKDRQGRTSRSFRDCLTSRAITMLI
jgi:hypothetical protein